MIEEFSKNIPSTLLRKSGSVFYSGRDAFSNKADLYILGINPGGDPDEQASETIAWHTKKVLQNEPDNWSAYRDESWKDSVPGTWSMQPRVLHLFNKLGYQAGKVPASNVIFQRSRRESNIKHELRQLADECWPFHQAILEELEPKAILCFGNTAGDIVRKIVGANKQIDEFIETNNRRWRSRAYQGSSGIKVIVPTHPSIADWTASDTDPTAMIKRVLSA
ncbi:MAG TPA: hypothetical protein EYQ42_02465 [Thiotrichaceae bacterium]|jgi:hypothetical protein|nr:hypothetical protein [Thiotrichaceae bacterium]HIM08124.1 hypothetical protein [Gammaproteobacteria bacterium]